MVEASIQKIRELRLAKIRAEIAAGTYETPEKLEAAIEAMCNDPQVQDLLQGETFEPRPNLPK